MAQQSFALMTTLGRNKEAAALANGTTINITHIAIGDGTVVPSGGETELYNEIARKTISGHGTVIGAANVSYFDCFIAAEEGPFTIREAGLYDDAGDLIAIAKYDPPINKPTPDSGQVVEGTIRLEVAFSDVANITIKVDPAMLVALQRLTVLPWIAVISMTQSMPPASPLPGNTYLIPTASSGSWSGHDGKIAEYTVAGWAIIDPPNGHGVSLPDGRIFERVSGSYVEKIALDVQSGKWGYAASGGTANALTMSLNPAPSSYTAGMRIAVKISVTSTGAATINVNGLGVKEIRRVNGASLREADLRVGMIAELLYDGESFILLSMAPAILDIPTGKNVLVLTESQNWTVPAGVTSVFARGVGGGGGGGGGNTMTGDGNIKGGGGGQGGGYFERLCAVTPGQVVACAVGKGGAGGSNININGVQGGTTSFGSYASALGGGAGFGDGRAGFQDGSAIGGDLNIVGGGGTQGLAVQSKRFGAPGGVSIFGGSSPSSQAAGYDGIGYGAGGGGGAGPTDGHAGGKGADGVLILSW